MYLNIGKKIIANNDIVGIFDLDITSQSRITRDFLKYAEKAGCVVNAAEDIPKSFIICEEKNKNKKVYLSQQMTATVIKHLEEEH